MNCRLCLSECEGSGTVRLFPKNEGSFWMKLIVKYLFIEIEENDPYSIIICRICSKSLEEFHNFNQHIADCQKLLKNEIKLVSVDEIAGSHVDENEEILLEAKNLIPEDEASIENPLSPSKASLDDNGTDKDDRTTIPRKAKKNKAKEEICKIKRKCSKGRSYVGSDTRQADDSVSIKQNPTAEEEKLGDELIARHIQLKCERCGESMETFKSLKTHSRKEHAIDGYATCCGRRFRLRCLLLDHIHVHLNPEHLKCEICNKILKSRKRLEIHKAIQHSDRQLLKYACELCGKRFPCSSNLSAHMLVHSKERNHICEICNKGFKSKIFLKAHKQTHKETKPFVCENCGREYRNKQSFERHIAEHEGRLEEPTAECSTCGKWFTFDGLQRHIRSHKLEDVECKVCGKILKSKNALRGHMDYSHRRQQVLACTFCEKTFKRNSVFKEHIAMHTGQKDYRCQHCPREFRSKANMYAHIKKMHVQEWAEAQLLRFKGPSVHRGNESENFEKKEENCQLEATCKEFFIGYLIFEIAERKHAELQRKDPAEFANDQ